jgi:hypothetical protein
MNSALHVIKRIANPRFLSLTATYDLASTIYLSIRMGYVEVLPTKVRRCRLNR